MKYQPTIHIDNEQLEQIAAGKLKIQCGQWIQLAWTKNKSRWVGLTKAKTFWAVHNHGYSMKKFSQQCKTLKLWQ